MIVFTIQKFIKWVKVVKLSTILYTVFMYTINKNKINL